MKIKAYTLFTDSHKVFLEKYLLPSFPYREEVDLTILYKPQRCKSGSFEDSGWRETMRDKATCFVDGITSCNENEIFMFIDPDIQIFGDFYDDVINCLKDKDVVFQNDVIGGVNTGFFAVRNNKKTRAFFKTVLGNLDNFDQEQQLANHLLRSADQYPTINIRWGFLPDKYWTYGHIAAQRTTKTENGYKGGWNPDADDFDIPSDIVIHHGNWTSGIANKIAILDIVKKKYEDIQAS